MALNSYFFSVQVGSRSSVYSTINRVRKTGSYIYEDFMPTDGTDVKVAKHFLWHTVVKVYGYTFRGSNFVIYIFASLFKKKRSGGGVVDNTLDYQSRDRKIDPPLLRSFG